MIMKDNFRPASKENQGIRSTAGPRLASPTVWRDSLTQIFTWSRDSREQ